jgi:hypothetical protein
VTAVSDAFEAWKAKVIADPSYVDAIVAERLTDILARRLTSSNLDVLIAEATAERDEVRALRDAAQSTLASRVGETYSVIGTTTAGSVTVTGDFATVPQVEGGWAQHANLRAGSIVADWSATTLTLSRPASTSGASVTISVQTGTLATADAQIAALTAQAADLQDQLDAIEDGEMILDVIADGRAALAAAGHYLAPRTILRSAPGAALTANQTTNLNTWLSSVPDGTVSSSNTAHLWRGVVYRADGTVHLTTRSDLNFDQHGSPLTAGATGGASRDHLRLTDCTRVDVRPVIRGSLPAGAPAYSATYTGQHGVQVLGGSAIRIIAPDIDGVLSSGIRVGASGVGKPNGVTVQGATTVTRCGNHVLAIAACDAFEWKVTAMGSSGRETIAVSPAIGVVCDDVSIHDFRLTGAVTDPAYGTVTARSGGKVTTFTIDGMTAEPAHGPITGDISATTTGEEGTDLAITNNAGAGILTNSARAAWQVAHYDGLRYTGNSQAMGRVGGSNVMYGMKGTDIGGTITVLDNTGTSALGQALIDGIVYPRTTSLAIATPTSLSAYAEDVDITNVTFTATGGVGNLTWSWAAASGSSLPPGGSFSSAGVLSTSAGGFTTPGTYNVEVTVTDSTSPTPQTATKSYSIVVTATSVFGINFPTSIPASFPIGTTISPIQFTTVNESGTVTWSKTGTLPAGLFWDLTGANMAKLRGTPTAAASEDVTFTATDSDGGEVASRTFTIVTAGLEITTTSPLPQATVGVPYSVTFAAAGGVGTKTWSTVSGKPAWLTKSGATYAGTPAAGDVTAGLTLTVKVTDSSTPTAQEDQEGFTLAVSATGGGYYDRRIGFCKGSADEAMIKLVGTRIAAGTDRLRGGLIRMDIGGVQMGGGANPKLGTTASGFLDAIASTGAKAMALNGYSHRDDQRTLTFQGSTRFIPAAEGSPAKYVVDWDGGTGTGLESQAGVPGHRPTLRANNMVFAEMSIHGPGIAYLRKFSGRTVNGETTFYCTLPTGDNPGAGVGSDWVGCGIKGPGIRPGTTIASPGPIAGGLKLSQTASSTQATNAGYTIGKSNGGDDPGPRQIAASQYNAGDQVYLTILGGVTAGKSGTYRLGGTNALGDAKMMTKDPMDAERIAAATVTQGGARVGVVEGWNEVAWPLGQRPFTDVPLGCRVFAHQYVGMKVAAAAAGRTVHFMFPGTGMVNDANPRFPTFMNADEWYEACLDFYLNEDPDYFTDLCKARGVTKNVAPKFPADILAMHPYGQGVTDPNNMGMNQCARVYNAVGAAAGFLPFAIVEQGLEWTPTGTGTDNQGRPNLTAGEAYTRYIAWIDIMHGNRPWPYKTRLLGPATGVHLPNASTDSTTGITVATRQAKMQKAHGCPCWFAICTPFGAHGELGIGWEYAIPPNPPRKKYDVETPDPLQAMCDC